jgi:GNAT superfamily N-acetyltransferase
MAQDEVRIEVKRGAEVRSVIPAVSRLRTEVFREWPYLYAGDPALEKRYFAAYAKSPRAAVVVARANEAIVGASTCLPLIEEEAYDVKAPFVERGWDPVRFFYYGDFVLQSEFRGRGIGVALTAAADANAKALANSDFAVLCSVVRSPNHPACPPDYVPLDGFWTRRGFVRRPDLVCRIAWTDVGADRESEHDLVFWIKSLSGMPLPP